VSLKNQRLGVGKKPGEGINAVNFTVGNGIKTLYDCQYFPPEITEVHADCVTFSTTISFFRNKVQGTLVKVSGFHGK
jgi:hypothetical protein